ncbi:beta-N-acetylhexosaminidase [Streptomyces albipurpureus]|uniref:beta-N-acetylhexosaminidase n=1 Tax=Streptomyces albipurpureus TaxID=2897419 RepID=A0ABT0UF98_9ACTN|nr:family 20 glycosylhydrolase [Streptomyces sp. CWNU-1]MCM2387283.1 beta-N-acetylhexosaminidase [Streptomyces sp. CWNU-1]
MTIPVVPAVHRAVTHGATRTVDATTAVVVLAPELADLAKRFSVDIALDAGVTLAGVTDQPADASITLDLSDGQLAELPPASGVRADGVEVDERHGIEITSDGIRVWGPTPEAVHRGLTTLRQLITERAVDGAAVLDQLRILDAPRFSWRGLSLDVARTFHDVETVRRVIDMLSLYKLNVLHLHLTDDQGWRVEIPDWPLLTEVGAAGAIGDRPGGFYSTADVVSLVRYASERFVTLVPEVDMPGHTSAVFRSYPRLAPATAEGSAGTVGNLNPDDATTLRFVDDVVGAVAAQFTTSAYVHIGGDEAFGMPDEAHARFVDRAMDTVKRHGRRVVGWQEIARAGVGPGDLVQYWMEPTSIQSTLDAGSLGSMVDSDVLASMVPPEMLPLLAEALGKSIDDIPTALAKGATILVSPTTRLYLDRPHAESSTDIEQDESRARIGLQVYPAATLREFVEWDPLDETPMVDSDAQLAGVEAAVWCETVSGRDDLEFLLLPRLAGVGEKAWAAIGATSWDDYADRLAPHSTAWDRRGWAWFRSSLVAWELKGAELGA